MGQSDPEGDLIIVVLVFRQRQRLYIGIEFYSEIDKMEK